MTTDLDDLARLTQARTNRAARYIARALTPANVVLALMAFISVTYARTPIAGLLWWLPALALVVGVPYLILFEALRSGNADDRQVVRRSQRPALFAAAAGAVVVALPSRAAPSAPGPRGGRCRGCGRARAGR